MSSAQSVRKWLCLNVSLPRRGGLLWGKVLVLEDRVYSHIFDGPLFRLSEVYLLLEEVVFNGLSQRLIVTLFGGTLGKLIILCRLSDYFQRKDGGLRFRKTILTFFIQANIFLRFSVRTRRVVIGYCSING